MPGQAKTLQALATSARKPTSINSLQQLLTGGRSRCNSRTYDIPCLCHSDGKDPVSHVEVALWASRTGPPSMGRIQVPEALRNLWRAQRNASVIIKHNMLEYVSENVATTQT